jgi:hypothetical protein
MDLALCQDKKLKKCQLENLFETFVLNLALWLGHVFPQYSHGVTFQ